jgi:tetratricopeptide (TPR) repeat protein
MYPIALLKAGQIPEAETAYETARARFPKNRILVQQWLVGLRSMGRADQGLAAARTALQDLGEDAAVLHHAALCLEALGQVQEAMEYHRRSVAADPKSPSASRLQKTGTPD